MTVRKPLVLISGQIQEIPSSDTISSDYLLLTDVATNNASSLAHGFLPKLSDNAGQYLNGQGNWATPSGIANAYVAQSFTSQTSVTVTHNFGGYPVVDILDGSGSVLNPLTLSHSSINAFTVTFSESTSGTIVATLGSPQLQNYLASANNYTGLSTDYYIEITAAAKTFTLPTAVSVTGKKYEIVNSSSGALTIATTSSQTINGALTYTLQSKSALCLFSNGSNWLIASAYYVADGWFDILPVSFKDDASSGWAWEQIGTSGRYAHTASSNPGIKTIHFKHHIPHEIQFGATEAYLHFHGETADNTSASVELIAYVQMALRDGAWSIEYPHPFIWNPATLATAGKNNIIEVALNSNLLAYLVPDAMTSIRFERYPNNPVNPNNDTYAGKVYIHTLDMHVKSDGKLTTSKDVGTGWVKV